METLHSQAVFIDVCSLTEFSHKNYFGVMMCLLSQCCGKICASDLPFFSHIIHFWMER